MSGLNYKIYGNPAETIYITVSDEDAVAIHQTIGEMVIASGSEKALDLTAKQTRMQHPTASIIIVSTRTTKGSEAYKAAFNVRGHLVPLPEGDRDFTSFVARVKAETGSHGEALEAAYRHLRDGVINPRRTKLVVRRASEMKAFYSPIRWLVEGLIPMGTTGDVFGPPGEGKSTIITSLALAITGGQASWFGRRLDSGNNKVVIVGGESSDEESWSRDLHRLLGGLDKDWPYDLVQLPTEEEPCWQYDGKSWNLTELGVEITDYIAEINPALIILDTASVVAWGESQVDNNEQHRLGQTWKKWRKGFGKDTVLLSVSHTNQASASYDIERRLHYLSRAGGNGLPGALRWIAGVSRVTQGNAKEYHLPGNLLSENFVNRTMVAFGVSKHNEMGRPEWSNITPVLFEIDTDGSLLCCGEMMPQGLHSASDQEVVSPLSEQQASGKSEHGKESKKIAKNSLFPNQGGADDDDW